MILYSFESTYKELKLPQLKACRGILEGFESTYKELKLLLLIKILRNWLTSFESTYKELKPPISILP